MSTVSYKFHIGKMHTLEMAIRKLHAFLLLLLIILCYGTFYIYQNWQSEVAAKEIIEAFKTSNQEALEIWTNERKDFVKHNKWKGRLRKFDAKKVAYYDSKIEELKVRNQVINSLEIKLSTP